LPDPTGDRLLALLLIWALLLCHGIFGSLHELSNLAIPEHPAAESHQGEHAPARHLQAGAHDYAAALLALLLGAVYWFLRLEARSRNASPRPGTPCRSRPPEHSIFLTRRVLPSSRCSGCEPKPGQR
jgi:hypothetical protein